MNSIVETNEMTNEASADVAAPGEGDYRLRREIVSLKDYRIFVQVDFEVALRRAMERAHALFRGANAVRTHYLQRYFPGQQLYFQRDHPQQRADAIVDNNNPTTPHLFFSPSLVLQR